MSDDPIERFFMKTAEIRVQAWVLGVVAWFLAFSFVTFGALVERAATEGVRADPVSRAAHFVARLPANAVAAVKSLSERPQQASADQYKGSSGLSSPPTSDGKVFADSGVLLLSRFDGDAGRSIVELVKLSDGAVLARFAPDLKEIKASMKIRHPAVEGTDMASPAEGVINHPYLDDDGTLIFNGMYGPLVKIDRCGNVIWMIDGAFHHAIERDADGQFWTAGVRIPANLRRTGAKFQNDLLVRFTSDGKITFQKSLARILRENNQRQLIFGQGEYQHDPLHLNDIQPVLVDGPYWRRGDLFLSLRNRSMILLYRPSTNEIVRSKQGPWMMQHDVDILDDRRIAVFNNNTAVGFYKNEVIGTNETLIYDFDSGEVASPYREGFERNQIRTSMEGLSEILSNGDIFVEDSLYGRLLRMDRTGVVRWRYINRNAKGRLFVLHWSRYLSEETASRASPQLVDADCASRTKSGATAQ